jgi:hypothetical protein
VLTREKDEETKMGGVERRDSVGGHSAEWEFNIRDLSLHTTGALAIIGRTKNADA